MYCSRVLRWSKTTIRDFIFVVHFKPRGTNETSHCIFSLDTRVILTGIRLHGIRTINGSWNNGHSPCTSMHWITTKLGAALNRAIRKNWTPLKFDAILPNELHYVRCTSVKINKHSRSLYTKIHQSLLKIEKIVEWIPTHFVSRTNSIY